MKLTRELKHLRTLFTQGGELFLLRVRILRLDIEEQLSDILIIFISILVAAVLGITGLAALLLGLNALLPSSIKMWLFFGIAVSALIAVCVIIKRLPHIWHRSNRKIADTLAEMQNDFVRLSKQPEKKETAESDSVSVKGEQNV